MNYKAKSICIVTPTYISRNPRVVKEADALSQAGFKVKVIFSQGNLEEVRYHDELLLKEKTWDWASVCWSPFRKKERFLYWKSRFRQHLCKRLPSPLWRWMRLAEYGEARVYPELVRLAAQEKADMYIGHYPAGLAAAAFASFCWKAKLGYDIEDLHTAEQPPNKEGKRKTQRIRIIESRYLPYCTHITCVSELVADEMVKRYNILRPLVIHNVFPWKERERLDGKIEDRKGDTLSLYWSSQVIAEERGIKDAIQACGLLKEKVQIHLRGYISEEEKNKLLSLARDCGVEKMLYIHPQVSSREYFSRAVEHDVGLAIDPPNSLNRRLTVVNKLFFYMWAGLAIAATDLPGQRYVLSTCPDAGFLYPPGDYQTLAAYINKLLKEPQLLQSYKQASLKAAQERWNWEKESKKLVENIIDIFSK